MASCALPRCLMLLLLLSLAGLRQYAQNSSESAVGWTAWTRPQRWVGDRCRPLRLLRLLRCEAGLGNRNVKAWPTGRGLLIQSTKLSVDEAQDVAIRRWEKGGEGKDNGRMSRRTQR